jgi:uncharacterized membrane protein YjjB (DUF3815 family)
LGEELLVGAFTGAHVLTPVAAIVEKRFDGPPSLGTIMPAIWLLVPGAIGLIGVAQFVGEGRTSGPGSFVDTLITFILIGLGVYLGNAIVLSTRADDTLPQIQLKSNHLPPAPATRAGRRPDRIQRRSVSGL